MRTIIILVIVLALLFLYWHGVTTLLTAQKGWNCKYHLAYALCEARNNKASLPSLWDIFVAGIKF
jgi:hypothetical protein